MTGTARNFGLSGAGKGSRPRNCGTKAFSQNYDEIDFTHFDGADFGSSTTPDELRGFKRTGNKLRKTYR